MLRTCISQVKGGSIKEISAVHFSCHTPGKTFSRSPFYIAISRLIENIFTKKKIQTSDKIMFHCARKDINLNVMDIEKIKKTGFIS